MFGTLGEVRLVGGGSAMREASHKADRYSFMPINWPLRSDIALRLHREPEGELDIFRPCPLLEYKLLRSGIGSLPAACDPSLVIDLAFVLYKCPLLIVGQSLDVGLELSRQRSLIFHCHLL